MTRARSLFPLSAVSLIREGGVPWWFLRSCEFCMFYFLFFFDSTRAFWGSAELGLPLVALQRPAAMVCQGCLSVSFDLRGYCLSRVGRSTSNWVWVYWLGTVAIMGGDLGRAITISCRIVVLLGFVGECKGGCTHGSSALWILLLLEIKWFTHWMLLGSSYIRTSDLWTRLLFFNLVVAIHAFILSWNCILHLDCRQVNLGLQCLFTYSEIQVG